ncbi:hypothetical protein V8E51_012381 [Hyaloscypha variabilis]
MDQYWEYESWDPSAGVPFNCPRPSRDEVERLRGLLLEGAKTLRLAPYIPHFWFYRSKILLKLLYPELAAVDAYKGVMLVNAAFDPRSTFGENARVQYGIFLLVMNGHMEDFRTWTSHELRSFVFEHLLREREHLFHVLVQALLLMRSPADMIIVSAMASYLHPLNQEFRQEVKNSYDMFQIINEGYAGKGHPFEEIKKQLSYGAIPAKKYPWIPEELSKISRIVVDGANEQLKTFSKCLEIRRATVQSGSPPIREDDPRYYGVYTKRFIRKGQ